MQQKLSVLNYQSTNTPHFVESNNKKFIEMGADNHYPHYLEQLFASSSIHGAVVKGCAEMIYGEGARVGVQRHSRRAMAKSKANLW